VSPKKILFIMMISSSTTKAPAEQQQHDDDDVALLTRFFGLVFLLSSPLYLLSILAGFHIVGPPELAMLYITLVTGIPCLAASILVKNKGARRNMYFTSFELHKDKVVWYVVALIIAPLMNVVTNVLVVRVVASSPEDIPTVAFDMPPLLLPIAGCAFIIMAAGEEIGWMTYAFEPLKRFHENNALRAAWRLGVIWALWHLPFFPILFPPPLSLTISSEIVILIANRIVCVWLYQNSSTLAVILYHAADNAALLFFPDFKAAFPLVPCVTAVVTALLIILWNDTATLTQCRLTKQQGTTSAGKEE
jgi:membrane protease YdiL (CAAX protease family)